VTTTRVEKVKTSRVEPSTVIVSEGLNYMM
jgi:hypothetical protein